jgi:Concanavalin A-like lectin/glucanases superfamily
MLLQLDRSRFVEKGFGFLEVMETNPTPGSFVNLGVIDEEGSELDIESGDVQIFDAAGQLWDSLPSKESNVFTVHLAQVGIDEINLINNAASIQYALRSYGPVNLGGLFQYVCMEIGEIISHISPKWKPGKQNLPFSFYAIKQDDSVYSTPLFYRCQAKAPLYLDGLELWLEPRLGLNVGTLYCLDISGNARHAVLNDLTIWQQGVPDNFLRFNGTTQFADLGNVLSIDPSGHTFIIEAWVNKTNANAIILSRHDAGTGQEYTLELATAYPKFTITGGSASASVTSTVALGSSPTHIAAIVDKTAATIQIYVNGVLASTPVDISSIGSITVTTDHLLLGKKDTSFGQVDIGNVRFRKLSTTPADIATQLLSHFNGERSYYGI